MTTIYLTHDEASRRNYYGARAFAALGALGEVKINDTGAPLAPDALAARAAGCAIIVSDRNTPGDPALFRNAPDLVAFLRCAVDIRTIDVDAASAAGVLVTNASPGFAASVSELVLGMMIDQARGISRATAAYHAGAAPEVHMGVQLNGATVGILGYGVIGTRLARVAQALGMTVLVNDPFKTVTAPGIEQVAFADLLARADFVVCLVVANPQTEKLIDAAAFAAMKPTAFFINVSRGNLVDEAALEEALAAGRIAGAALDVGRAPDQMPTDRLARLPTVSATPHIGGLTPAAIEAQAMETVEQVRALVGGRMPHNAVNADKAHRLARLGIAVEG